jgi:hypothetical protein
MSEKKDDHGHGGGHGGGGFNPGKIGWMLGYAIIICALIFPLLSDAAGYLGLMPTNFSKGVAQGAQAGPVARRELREWLVLGGSVILGILALAFIGILVKEKAGGGGGGHGAHPPEHH